MRVLALILLAGCSQTPCADITTGPAKVALYVEHTDGCSVSWTDSVISTACDAETSCGDLTATCAHGLVIDVVNGEAVVTVNGCRIAAHVTAMEPY